MNLFDLWLAQCMWCYDVMFDPWRMICPRKPIP